LGVLIAMSQFPSIDGLILFLLTLVPLVFLQRLLHREIQAVFLITTRHEGVTIGLFSLIFFPGVFLHESSHFIVAKILGVKTGKFSLLPQAMPDGRLQMGYVETVHTDVLRDSLVGLAPLVSGCIFIALVATTRLHFFTLWDFLKAGQINLFWLGLKILPTLPDFWLWFYLVFAVSSTMMPSASDRHAWRTIGLFAAGLLALALLAGAGPWMMTYIAPPLNTFFRSVALILGFSSFLHMFLLVPIFLLHRVVAKLTGLDIE
jgi:hypothetical protein